MVALVFFSMLISTVPIRLYFKSIKAIFVYRPVHRRAEPVLRERGSRFGNGAFKITLDGIFNSIFIAVRIICLILVSSILTFTTSPPS